jgi:hypothetical protein
MAADEASVAKSGCFLCGRPGAERLSVSSSEAIFQYECPVCGPYEIAAVVHDEIALAVPQELTSGSEFPTETKPVEMEAAAFEHWSKSLEAAERQRRLSAKATEPQQQRHTTGNESACA